MAVIVGRLAKWFVSLFTEAKQDNSTCREIARRGSTVIVRCYKELMFHVVDIAAEGGPELVGEYAIYRNAVIAAELWEYSKQRKF